MCPSPRGYHSAIQAYTGDLAFIKEADRSKNDYESHAGSVRISACVIRVDMSLIRGKYEKHYIRLCHFRSHGYRVHNLSPLKMYV